MVVLHSPSYGVGSSAGRRNHGTVCSSQWHTDVLCCFRVTLQGDLQLLLALLLASAVSEALAAPLRGEGWNEHQLGFLIRRSRVFTKECVGSSSSSLLPTASQAALPMASLAASSVQIIFESLVGSSLPRGIKSTQALPS